MIKDFEKIIFPGITGKDNKDWQKKIEDLSKLKISEAALFLERFDWPERKGIYRALIKSSIKRIPLVHAKNEMELDEFVFLWWKFKTEYFTIHESSFGFLDKWQGFQKKLYLEMNTDNYVSPKVAVEKIGGFCVDLSHFKVAQTRWIKDFDYVYFRKFKPYFYCNHLNGYLPKRITDLHTIKSLKDFDYLNSLPKFIFGKVIGLEMENSIPEQLRYKKYLVNLLNKKFNK